MNKKQKQVFTAYLDNRLMGFTSALNFWSIEANKTDNSTERSNECTENINYFKAAYNAVYEIFVELSR